MIIIWTVSVLLVANYALAFRHAARAFNVESVWHDPSAWHRAGSARARVLIGETDTDAQREGQRLVRTAFVGWILWLFFASALVVRWDGALREALGPMWPIGELAIAVSLVSALVVVEAWISPSLRSLRWPAVAMLMIGLVVASWSYLA